MRLFRPASLLVCSLLIPGSVAAQPPPRRDPQAVQLLTQAHAAMGGLRLPSITDVRAQGTLASRSRPDVVIGTFVAKARHADFSMDTIRNGEQKSYRVLNSEGSFRSKGKTKRLPPYNTSGLTLDFLPLFSRWTDFLNPTTAVRPVQTANLDGLPCYLIRVEAAEARQPIMRNNHGKVDVFLAVNTGLVVAIRFRATQGPYPTDQITIENRFADYQEFGGILLPTTVTRYIDGKPMLILRLGTVQLNNGFSDADFKN